MALEHRSATLSRRTNELYRLFDDFWIFFERAISSVVPSYTSLPVSTISLDDRVVVDIFEHSRIDRTFYMIHYTFDFISLNQHSLETVCHHRSGRKVEHITTSEKILSTDRVEDCPRIDIRSNGKCNTRGHISLNQTRDHVH